MNSIFEERLEIYLVVRTTSENQVLEIEELNKHVIKFAGKRFHLMKVSGAMKKKKDKTKENFVPNYLDPSEYANKVEIQARNVNGNIMIDALGNVATQPVPVVRDQAKKD